MVLQSVQFGVRPEDLVGLAMITDLASCHTPQMQKCEEEPDRAQRLVVKWKANETQKGM